MDLTFCLIIWPRIVPAMLTLQAEATPPALGNGKSLLALALLILLVLEYCVLLLHLLPCELPVDHLDSAADSHRLACQVEWCAGGDALHGGHRHGSNQPWPVPLETMAAVAGVGFVIN